MEINLWAVLVAAASSFLLGGLWYSPLLFLKPWNTAMGRTEEDNGHPAKVFGLSFAFSFLSAYVFGRYWAPIRCSLKRSEPGSSLVSDLSV